MIHSRSLAAGLLLAALPLLAIADSVPHGNKEALQDFNDLIGSWRGTATPSGSRAEQQKGFWIENLAWEWQFKGSDAWLKVTFQNSKNFTDGDLRYVPAKEQFALTVRTTAKETRVFAGPFNNRTLTLDRQTDAETQRIVLTMLHANRFLYRYEVRGAGKGLFTKQYTVGVTKEGVPFAAGDGKPVCIVSGGAGTMPVVYMGKTYYVCCGGCRDEFRENPAKYVREFEAKNKAK